MGPLGRAAALLSLILLLPHAGAAPAARLLATALEVDAATATAPLAGFAWEADGMFTDVGLPALRATADHGALVVDRAERPLVVLGIAVAPDGQTRSNATFEGLAIEVIAGGPGARLLVLPSAAGPAEVAASGRVAATGDPQRSHAFVPRASTSRPQFEFGPGGLLLDVTATAVSAAPATASLVAGHVIVVASGLALRITSADGVTTVDTRRQETGVGPAAQVVVREAVLELSGASVALPAGPVAVGPALLAADGPWTFRDARGLLTVGRNDVALAGEDAEVDGDLHVALAPATGGLDATVDGPIDRLSTAATEVRAQGGSWPGSPGAVVATMLSAVTLAALAASAHHLRGRARFGRLDQAMEKRDHAAALGLASRFRLHPRLAQDADLAAAVCLAELGRAADARDRLRSRRHWSSQRLPMRDFVLARAQGALGERDEARRSLVQSLLADPGLLVLARADPALAPLLPQGATGGRDAQEAYA